MLKISETEPLSSSKTHRLTRQTWSCIIGCFIVHFFYGGLLKSLSILYSPWQATFDVNNAEVSVVFSALATLMQLGAFSSKFLQTYGYKVLLLATGICVTGSVIAYLANKLATLAVGIGLIGFGLGIFRVRSISILSQAVVPEKRSLAISLGMIGTPVGSSVLPILWRYILYRYSTGQAMLILAGMISNLFIAALLLKQKSQNKEEKEASKPDSVRSIFSTSVTLYCISMFLNFSGKSSQFPFFVPFGESIGLKDYEPAYVVFLINVVDIFGRPIGGMLATAPLFNRHGGSLIPIIFFFGMALMNGLALVTIHDFRSYCIWGVIFGCVYAIPVPSTISCICEFTDVKNMNNVFSVNALVAMFGMILFPIMNGALVDYFGTYWVTFVVAGVLLFLSSICLIFARLFNRKVYSTS